MKKFILCAIMVSALFCVASVQQVSAQVVYGISSIDYDPVVNIVSGYSSTQTDYYASLYYDAYVEGYLYDPYALRDAGYDWEIGVAEVYTEAVASADTEFDLISDHYVVAYYYGYGEYYDPYGYDSFSGGEYGGGYDFNGCYCPGYVITNFIYLGSTGVALVTPPAPPDVSISEVGFTSDFPITTWASDYAIDQPDGSEPTWKSVSNPDYPVAYMRGGHPTVFANLSISPPPSQNMSADIRIKSGGNVIATKTGITVSGSTLRVDGVSISADLNPDRVEKDVYTFKWQISYDQGLNWTNMGNSTHTVYWTYATPNSSPFINIEGTSYAQLYDRALDKACIDAAGATTVSAIVGTINSGIDRDLVYNPSSHIENVHPLRFYDEDPPECLCADNANILRGLLRSIGVDANTVYYWGGSGQTRWIYDFAGGAVTFRVIRDAHDDAVTNPHFTYHAIVSAAGTLFDPSYGLTYSSLNFDETLANPSIGTFTSGNAHQSTSGSFEPYSEIVSGATCPHLE